MNIDEIKERDKKRLECLVEELQELLNKYDAEITAEDEFCGYAECGQDIHMRVTIDRCGLDYDLGSFVSALYIAGSGVN